MEMKMMLSMPGRFPGGQRQKRDPDFRVAEPFHDGVLLVEITVEELDVGTTPAARGFLEEQAVGHRTIAPVPASATSSGVV